MIFLLAIVKKTSRSGIVVDNVEIPKIKPDEVLLEVKAAAICGSDLGIYDFNPAYSKIMTLPVILGHEFSGRIEKIGNDVINLHIGDRVVSESVLSCGSCHFCKKGMENLCDSSKLFGVHLDGGFAQYVAVPYTKLHKLPKTVSYEEAALIEPLSDSIHMVMDITRPKFGDFVVVLGCGPIGLLSSKLFSLAGANVILTGIDVDRERMRIANKLGFQTINVEKENLEEILQRMKKEADIAFVAVGAKSAVSQACKIVKKHGQVTIVGIFPTNVEIPMTQIVRREVCIAGAYAATWSNYEQAIKLVENGAINLKALVTHKFPFKEARKAFEMAKTKKGFKVEFIPKR